MKSSLRLFPITLLLFLGLPSVATAVVDSDAPVVLLRTTCQEGSTTLDNCFTAMADVLDWTYNTRLPSAAAPLLIDIGPGTFAGFNCNGSGHITLRGAGRHNTVIGSTKIGFFGGGPGCARLAFQDLSVVNTGGWAVQWWGSGSSSWSNVEITGNEYAWWDIRYEPAPPSQHYWWDTALNATGSAATLQTYGAIHRFFGGEINLTANGDDAQAVWLNNAAGVSGEIQMYGSAIRVKAEAGSAMSTLRGVQVNLGQVFHDHGGTIGVDASAAASTNVSVEGIKGQISFSFAGGTITPTGTSRVHVYDVAYNLKPKGTGQARRISSLLPGFSAEAPFVWATGYTPPEISSMTGADMFVEIDCSSAGCATQGDQPHLLIYDIRCDGAGGPWFDVVTANCR